ncbi:hypothetical protein HDV04_000495 [Boothiomyces sp. JEL0838]|nr:hypothetical protein HDV04_000495 [Boothiomyces sp. JEL0838]
MQQKTFRKYGPTEGHFYSQKVNNLDTTVTAQLDLSYKCPFNVHDLRAKVKLAVHQIYWEQSMLRCCFTDNGDFTQFTEFKDPNLIIPVYMHESTSLKIVQEQLLNKDIDMKGPLWFVTIVYNPSQSLVSILVTCLAALLDVDSLYTVIDLILSKLDSAIPVTSEFANYGLFNFKFRPEMDSQLLKRGLFGGYFDAWRLYNNELQCRLNRSTIDAKSSKQSDSGTWEQYSTKIVQAEPIEYAKVLKLVETARHEGTTLTGLLNAASLVSLTRTFGNLNTSIGVYTMLNTRNHLQYTGLGSYSIYSFGAFFKPSKCKFWDLVYASKFIIKQRNVLSVIRGNAFRGKINQSSKLESIINIPVTSNIGDISSKVSREYFLKSSVLQVQSSTFFYGHSSLFLSATTCNGKLNLCLTYRPINITEQDASKYLKNVRDLLTELPPIPEGRTIPFLTILLPIIFVFGVSFLKE